MKAVHQFLIKEWVLLLINDGLTVLLHEPPADMILAQVSNEYGLIPDEEELGEVSVALELGDLLEAVDLNLFE